MPPRFAVIAQPFPRSYPLIGLPWTVPTRLPASAAVRCRPTDRTLNREPPGYAGWRSLTCLPHRHHSRRRRRGARVWTGPRPAPRHIRRWHRPGSENDLVEGQPLAVREELPPQRMPACVGGRGTVADRRVDHDRVRPLRGSGLPQPHPDPVVVERARYCEFPATIGRRASCSAPASQAQTIECLP